MLTVGWLARELQTRKRVRFQWTIGTLVVAGVVGVGGSWFMHYGEKLYPLLSMLVPAPTEDHPHPLRQVDPACRLRGWRTLAAEVDRVCAELRAEGVEPVIAATNWSLPGELGFYCAGHPEVQSIGLALRDRRSQYDFWRPNPIWDAGRTFVVVGPHPPEIAAGFEELGPPTVVTHIENGKPIAAWGVRVCRGFRGFAPVEELLQTQHY